MEGIGFKNMKVFKEEQWFDFKNITLLTGTNNSGKSSIINAMQMLQENIKATNIDELIKTEFKISSNQNKYGSIATFVNNEATSENNNFVFVRQIKNVEYKVQIDINSGLESYGRVKQITAIDIKTKTEIFNLIVNKPYPDYECTFNINYKYFIDRFNKKCENTERLRHWIVELDKLTKEVYKKKKNITDLKKLVDITSKEFSVYINLFETPLPDGKKAFHYLISNEYDEISINNQKIEEIGVLFNERSEFISEEEYSKLYETSYKKGIFDFSQLWEKNPEIETEFENIICSYYKKNFIQSHKMLCDDLITLISNSNWDMEFENDDWEPELLSEYLTRKFIDSFPDFGLIGLMIKFNNDDESNISTSYVADDYVKAKQTFIEKSESMLNLSKTNFFEKVYLALQELFIGNEYEISINHRQLIAEPVFCEIFDDITQTILKLNLGLCNVYVSSNRFTTKRSYNFNDNTDFTNLLKQVEEPCDWQVNHCKEFISKWIKEFGIADELLLKPDLETGNFKASLRIGNKETQLADFGLGTNQLLPIIFSLGIHKYLPKSEVFGDVMIPRTVVIEEPETNLHPALQSKLADMFVDANVKFGVQIIAETHSEYLIRRMQYLVAKNELQNKNEDTISIANDKVNIHYINAKLDEEGRKAYEINFTKNGQLTESFGKGFLDETTALQFDLYRLNNAQSN